MLPKCCRNAVEVLSTLDPADVPGGRTHTMKDIAQDPRYSARDIFVPVPTDDRLIVETPVIVPKLSVTSGAISRREPTLGELG